MHYIGDSYPESFHKACAEHKYTKVFLLPPWKEIYVSDTERYETYEQATLLHKHLKETYTSFGYDLIEVPKGSVETRVDFVMKHISK